MWFCQANAYRIYLGYEGFRCSCPLRCFHFHSFSGNLCIMCFPLFFFLFLLRLFSLSVSQHVIAWLVFSFLNISTTISTYSLFSSSLSPPAARLLNRCFLFPLPKALNVAFAFSQQFLVNTPTIWCYVVLFSCVSSGTRIFKGMISYHMLFAYLISTHIRSEDWYALILCAILWSDARIYDHVRHWYTQITLKIKMKTCMSM